jgi:hypothetical protein
LSVVVLHVPAEHEQETTLPVHGSVKLPQVPAAHVFGVQHVPPLPQVPPPGAPLQVFVAPQLTVLPLQSVFVPQSFGPQGLGHWHVLAMHDVPPVQPPQLTLSPQLFFTVPHFPLQTAGGGGGGHFVQLWRMFPQPSATPVPGSQTPGLLQVRGVQPQPFVSGLHAALVHWLVPQSIVTPQPVIFPHLPVQLAVVGAAQDTHWWVFASQIWDAPASALAGQEPQLIGTPHESTIVPHSAPAA